MPSNGPWPATGLLALAFALGTGPASAAMQHASVSATRDDQYLTTSVDTPVFAGSKRWVPGDTETVSVWLHNPWAGAADLDVTTADDKSWKASDLVLSAHVGGRPVPLGDHPGPQVAGNTPVHVDLTVTLPRSSADTSQDLRTRFRVALRLTQVDSPAWTDQPYAQSADQPQPSGLSVPVAGRHVTENGALPVGVPLTLAAVALALRAALRGRRTPPRSKDIPCP